MLLPTELWDYMVLLRFELRFPDSKSGVITDYTIRPVLGFFAPSRVYPLWGSNPRPRG